jgi:hypothetical protein
MSNSIKTTTRLSDGIINQDQTLEMDRSKSANPLSLPLLTLEPSTYLRGNPYSFFKNVA